MAIIEGSFLVANLIKFPHGGWVSLAHWRHVCMVAVMYVWLKAYLHQAPPHRIREAWSPTSMPLKQLSNDDSIPKYSTHLVFLTSC